MELTIPDGCRWVLVTCTPDGEHTRAQAEWDDSQLDATAAYALLEMAMADVGRRAQEEVARAARLRLLTPLAQQAAHEAGALLDAAAETPATNGIGTD